MPQQAFAFETQITKSVHLNYLLFLPKSYGLEPGVRWPLILFLHGAGERGDNVEIVKRHGIPKIVEQQEDFPFVAVSPQCPERTWWIDYVDALVRLLDTVSATHAVDPDRVYLTGMSMGGFGAWHLAAEHPDRFAAVAPICGGGMFMYGYPEHVCALKHVPVWAFHGAKDDTVPLRESAVLVETLQACGGNVRFTVYPEAEHDSWTETYNNPELYAWFLSHVRRPRKGDAG